MHIILYTKIIPQPKPLSSIKLLSNKERIEEIAKMIGGSKPSKVALENAQEIIRPIHKRGATFD